MGATIVAGVPGCVGAGASDDFEHDWPSVAYDAANTGYTRAQGPGDPAERWSVEPDRTGGSPAVVNGTVYVGGALEGELYALEAGTGDERWTYSVDGRVGYAPAVAERTIYVATDSSSVHAVATDGTEEWRVDVEPEVVSSCAVDGDVVCVSTLEGSIVALDADSGDERWRRTGGAIAATPAIVDGRVYSFGAGAIADDSQDVGIALDAATGDERWRYEEWDRTALLASHTPSVGDDAVYVGTGTNELLAVDVATGDERWLADLDGHATQPAVVGEETLYVGVTPGSYLSDLEGGGSSVVAVDAASGDEQWRHETDAFASAVALGADRLYNRTLGGVAALEPADGEPVWRHDATFGPPWEDLDGVDDYNLVDGTDPPAVVDGALFVASPSGGAYAVGEG